MSFTKLSVEIIQIIFLHTTLPDAHYLAQTSKSNHQIFLGHRLPILRQTIYNTYAPIPELLKLSLSNDLLSGPIPYSGSQEDLVATLIKQFEPINSSTELDLDIDLLKKLARYGKVAERWVQIYPSLRWRFKTHKRRSLREDEKEKLRRAVYIYWVYADTFHGKDSPRNRPQDRSPFFQFVASRDTENRLLDHWSVEELSQVSDLAFHIEKLLKMDLFPSEKVMPPQPTASTEDTELVKWVQIDLQKSRYLSLIDRLQELDPKGIFDLMDASPEKRLELVRNSELIRSFVGLGNWMGGTLNASLHRAWRNRVHTPLGIGDGPYFPSLVSTLELHVYPYKDGESNIETWSNGRKCPITGWK